MDVSEASTSLECWDQESQPQALTRARALLLATRRLSAAGIGNPRREARLLLGHALGLDQEELVREPGDLVGKTDFPSLLARRCRREPLAFILGQREFWSLLFEVSPATLIPRPETETLVELAVSAAPDRSRALRVLDLGTGTGCLLLAVLSEFPAAFGVAVDRSEAAVRLAGRNARKLGLAGRTAFLCADWAEPLNTVFDLIVCNPPYIPSGTIPALMPEVSAYEPASALDGGADGLDAYRALLGTVPALLAAGGVAILELGAGQASAVTALAQATGLAICLRPDLTGVARALMLRRT